ncbi:MAG: DNA gyrase inhibitor YacG [Candidatus Solibacter usitatus]|nr:DNA gyrase inhibitor YacG [Candidatus Solibacter usitatus]
MKCPICKKEVRFGAPLMPFCSERCRLIDLGNWSDETYRIPVEQAAPKEEAESDE